MAAIEPLGIDAIELPHTGREVSIRRFKHQMVVVVHQTVSMAEPVEAAHNRTEHRPKGVTPFFLIEK